MNSSYVVAVVGGACAGSEIASLLNRHGLEVIVIDQNDLPYGKIEDGLPRWHDKLQHKEMKSIDEKLSQPGIHFLPGCRVGTDLSLDTMINDWKLPLVVMATGAWRDRAMRGADLDQVEDDSFVYQNPFVYWFNHYHEKNYDGKTYQVHPGSIVVGGGLASIDVAKICQFELVRQALRERGKDADADIIEMEHRGIHKILDRHGLTWDELGLEPTKLFYRKRVCDMPLVPLGDNPTPEKLAKAATVREKLVRNATTKYGFEVHPLRAPSAFHIENGSITGVTFAKNEYQDGSFVKTGETERFETRLVVSSIGSIPEPIEGIPMDGELYKWDNYFTGAVHQLDNVYCVGNAITGRGNIKDSARNARRLGELVTTGLENGEIDYGSWFKGQEEEARGHVEKLLNFLKGMPHTSADQKHYILEQVGRLQSARGYEQGYDAWRDKVLSER